MTNEEAVREAREHVPADIRVALTDAGFVPTADAGNLWFYDRGQIRLLFGEDGSDYPTSMNEPVCACDGPDDDEGTEYATLAEALEAFRHG